MKKEYIFLGVIIIALTAYLLLHDSNRSRFELPALPELSEKDLTKIEIQNGEKSLTLIRDAADWFTGPQSWRVDSGKMKLLAAAVANLRLTALVSTAKAYGRYDLTDDKKIVVTAWAGDKEVRKFDVGKAADTYQHTFVLLPGDENVYHAMEDLRRTFETTADDIRDKKVMAVPAGGIKEITLARDKKHVVISRAEEAAKIQDGKDKTDDSNKTDKKMETVWRNRDGKTLDKTAVERFISKFSGITCESYIKDKKKEDFSTPAHMITLTGEKPFTLSIFNKTDADGGFPAVSSENGYPFILREYVFYDIKKDMDLLMGVKPKE